MDSKPVTSGKARSTVGLVRVAIAVALLQAIFVLAYVLPGRDAQPHDLPVAVVGSTAVAAQVGARLEKEDFRVVEAGDAAAARRLILDREVYGALLLDGRRPGALTASAASIGASQVVTALAASAGVPAEQIEDVVPLTANDSRGVAFTLLALPLVITSVLGAQLALLLLGGRISLRTRVLSIAGVAAAAGLSTATIVGPWFEIVPGNFLAEAGLLALAVAGLLLVSGGLIRLLGPAGLGASFFLFLVIGNPASGATSAPELIPAPWQQIGALMPPGSLVTALRDVAYFDGAALAKPVLALIATVLLGIALEVAAERRNSARSNSKEEVQDVHARH